jgi:hypothetical protein
VDGWMGGWKNAKPYLGWTSSRPSLGMCATILMRWMKEPTIWHLLIQPVQVFWLT